MKEVSYTISASVEFRKSKVRCLLQNTWNLHSSVLHLQLIVCRRSISFLRPPPNEDIVMYVASKYVQISET